MEIRRPDVPRGVFDVLPAPADAWPGDPLRRVLAVRREAVDDQHVHLQRLPAREPEDDRAPDAHDRAWPGRAAEVLQAVGRRPAARDLRDELQEAGRRLGARGGTGDVNDHGLEFETTRALRRLKRTAQSGSATVTGL